MTDPPSLRRTPGVARLLTVALVDRTGSGLFVPISVVYLHRVVGLSLTDIGLVLTLAGLVGTLGPLVSGRLLRRLDPRWVVAGCFLTCAAALSGYAQARSFASVLAVATVLQVATRMERPGTAVLALGLSRDRIGVLSWQQTWGNLGYGLGALAAAGVLLVGSHTAVVAALLADAASYVVGAALVATLPRPLPTPGSDHRTTYRELLVEPRAAALLGLHGVLALHDSVLLVGLPAWVLATGVTPAVSPALFALNTVLVVALQVRVARWVARTGGPDGYARAGLLLGAACVTFALSATVPHAAAAGVLIGAVALLTLGETGHTAAEAWLAVALTEGRAPGTVLGLVKTTMSVQQALGPLLVVMLLAEAGRTGWVILAALIVAAAMLARRLAGGHLGGRAVTPAVGGSGSMLVTPGGGHVGAAGSRGDDRRG
jgi:MFS family permease